MKKQPIRYAVVGLGHIAQVAVLPAFKNCKLSTLNALVSGDSAKLKLLARKYRVKNTYSYEEYDECLASGLIDAVYIALPNDLHKEYTIRAAQAGIHVLCEKPMAITSSECREMILACEANYAKLMIAYRLHFEAANLKVIDLIHRSKKIGEPRLFQSLHSQAANFPNIRTLPINQGGGPTFDIGIYDINAARYLFQDEPVSVLAEAGHSQVPAFQGIEEAMSITLKFPQERLASILYSFGATKTDTYRVVGTEGDITLDSAYSYTGAKRMHLMIEGKETKRVFKPRDQFSPEIDYFSECIRNDRVPEPSGLEGLADIKIIEAIYQSAVTGKVVQLTPVEKFKKPEISQKITRLPIEPPPVFHAEKPTRKKAA